MADRPRILFSTPVLRHPAVGGPYLRIENAIKALARVSELYICNRAQIEDLAGLNFYHAYCRRFYFAPSTYSASAEEDFHHVLDLAASLRPDIIWLGYGNICYPLLRFLKERSAHRVVVDTDSVWSRFVLRKLPYAKDEDERQQIEDTGRRKEAEEQWGTQLADVTLAVSAIDAEYYRGLARCPDQVHVFSNVIDVQAYQIVPPTEGLERPCIYLAGTFWPGSPMEEAARWVIEEILPQLRREIPLLHFYIVGMGSNEILADVRDPRITITGELPSVLPYLFHADVALVPLKFESGTRFKILEAGACGVPVGSTTLGAEGIPVTHGQDILLADDPENFADAILRLILDRGYARKQAQALKRLIKEQYTIDTLVEEAQHILEYLMCLPRLGRAAEVTAPRTKLSLHQIAAHTRNTLRAFCRDAGT